MSGERSGNAHDDGVLLGQFFERRGGTEAMMPRILDLGFGNPKDIGSACLEIGHLLFVNVEPRHFESRFGEQQREGETHVSEPDDADFGSTGREALKAFGGYAGESVWGGSDHVGYYCTQALSSGAVCSATFVVAFASCEVTHQLIVKLLKSSTYTGFLIEEATKVALFRRFTSLRT